MHIFCDSDEMRLDELVRCLIFAFRFGSLPVRMMNQADVVTATSGPGQQRPPNQRRFGGHKREAGSKERHRKLESIPVYFR